MAVWSAPWLTSCGKGRNSGGLSKFMWGVGKTPGGNAAIVGVAHADGLAGPRASGTPTRRTWTAIRLP